MKQLFELNEKVASRKFEVANDKIKQTERNTLKKEFLDTLKETFGNAGFDVERTADGVVLVLQAENTPVYIAVDAVIKNLDYDLDFEVSEYGLKLEKQAEREKARAEKAKANAK